MDKKGDKEGQDMEAVYELETVQQLKRNKNVRRRKSPGRIKNLTEKDLLEINQITQRERSITSMSDKEIFGGE